MIVLVDIGNSRCKYVFCVEGQLSPIQWLDNNDISADWLSINWQNVSRCMISNVRASALSEMLELWCKSNQVEFTNITTEAEKNGVSIAYQEPRSLGVDRWLALLAAAKLFKQKNILIVDAGTATTIDLLTATGQHIGGWVFPGISAMHESLQLNTAHVQVSATPIKQLALGTSTVDCVNNALWAGTIGLIEQAQDHAQLKHIYIDNIIVTGGNGEKLTDLMTTEAVYVPSLIFYGLQQYI